MATIIGMLRPDATAGETEVYNRLKELPDCYIVWPELAIHDRYPDFVILVPGRGVAVLEVKDWVEITKATPDTFTVCTRAGQVRNENNPITALREKTFAVARRLEAEPQLIHDSGQHLGKSRVPTAYAVIFPRLTNMFLYQLGNIFDDPRCVISRDKLIQRTPADLLHNLNWRFSADLSANDLTLIRGALWPELKVTAGAQVIGVMDTVQEQTAKEGLYEVAAAAPPTEDLPEHGRALAVNPVIRLVRGVAGSGKTLVLARRSAYLSEIHPHWNILVVTYSKALAHKLRGQLADCDDRITVTNFHQLARELLDNELGDWGNGPVNDTRGAVANILTGLPPQDRFDLDFLAAEIRWLKESGIDDLTTYLGAARVGRGRPLSPADRHYVFDIYLRYKDNLQWRRRFDWDDVPQMVTRAIDTAALPGARYHAILIDEAQDFAPSWFGVLRRLLHPDTAVMFMAADGTQRIYRHHSWRSLGLQVVGRTRILPYPYRMTYEIAAAAVELVRSNPALIESLRGDEEELPHARLDAHWMRHGRFPEVYSFPDQPREFRWLGKRVTELCNQHGYTPADIAVFHRKQKGVDDYAGFLMQNHWPVRVLKSEAPVEGDGITVGTMHAAKGLEFRAVFVPQLQTLFNHNGTSADERRAAIAEETRLLYVALTRARERVYLMHQGQLPEQLSQWAGYLKQARAQSAPIA